MALLLATLFCVNSERVQTFAEMGEAANIRAEPWICARGIDKEGSIEITEVARGYWAGLPRLGAMIVGVVMAGVGHTVGTVQLYRRRRFR